MLDKYLMCLMFCPTLTMLVHNVHRTAILTNILGINNKIEHLIRQS